MVIRSTPKDIASSISCGVLGLEKQSRGSRSHFGGMTEAVAGAEVARPETCGRNSSARSSR